MKVLKTSTADMATVYGNANRCRTWLMHYTQTTIKWRIQFIGFISWMACAITSRVFTQLTRSFGSFRQPDFNVCPILAILPTLTLVSTSMIWCICCHANKTSSWKQNLPHVWYRLLRNQLHSCISSNVVTITYSNYTVPHQRWFSMHLDSATEKI